MRLTVSTALGLAGSALGICGLLLPKFLPGTPQSVSVVLVATAVLILLLSLAWWGHPAESLPASAREKNRRYGRALMLTMACYIVILLASIWVLNRVDLLPLRLLAALAPVVPIAFSLRAMVRFIRNTDEMQQRIELEAVSVATIVVSMLYMAGGFLQQARLIDIPAGMAMIWVFPLMCASYGIAKAIVSRRYG